jgi:predicted CoA-binding protein
VLGLKCYRSLADVPGAIDLVNVFRRPQYCPGVVEEAITKRARGVWIQSGIRSAEARRMAEAAGLDYIEDRCIMVEHIRNQV